MSEEEYLKGNFNNLAAVDSTVNGLETVIEFIKNSIGDVCAEKVSVDCDTESKIVNVSYRFSNGIVVSVSKPLETMDDEFVSFNAYSNRKLLVSDITTIPMLMAYLRGICIIDNDLDKFCNEHCKTCGTQRCEGVYSEEWRNGCKEYNEQLNSHANLCDVGDILQRCVKENT